MSSQTRNWHYLLLLWFGIFEDGAFEILVLLAGLMPNSESSTSLIAMWSVFPPSHYI
ncbi:Protein DETOXIFICATION 19 [Bienertia sinuspersici]